MMRNLKYIVPLFLLASLMAAQVLAQPVIFSRGIITIIPSADAPSLQKNEKAESVDEKETPPKTQRLSHQFNVEIRLLSTLYTQGMFNQQPLGESEGILLVQETAVPIEIVRANIYTPRDVVLLASDGTIQQILPDIMLAEMEESIASRDPVRAVLHLRAGSCEQFDIRPQDRVAHELFKKKQVVIE